MRKEVKIGFIGIIALALLFFGINYLKGVRMFHASTYYYVEYTDINGLTNMVMSRHFLSSIIRVAMIAGTLHPNPIINGMNDLPCNPILCMILSIIKAARAM